ncbi:MAG: hypothetical protein RLZZ67_116 [Candidatus Parcubacteria bacterium]|jgi:hypothetical protein
MNPRKIKIVGGLFCVCTLLPLQVFGQIVLTEIMYDVEGTDIGREWVEVQNTGSSAVDLSLWKFFEANTAHKLVPLGDTAVPPSGFAVITDNADKFKADNPGFSGPLFDSTFSLSNEGETLVIKDPAGADSDSVTYQPALGGAGDGTTLQKTTSGWISAPRTPGSATTATESAPTSSTPATSTPIGTTEDTETSEAKDIPTVIDTLSTHSSQSVALVAQDKEEFQVTAGRSRLGFVGVPLIFEGKIKIAKNTSSGSLQGVWSLGDGTEQTGDRVSHVYEFPGDYIVVLNSSLGNSSAVTKVKVRILDPQVGLALSGEHSVEIKNELNSELNIGGWILETASKRFIVPRDTLIAKKSAIKISLNVGGLYPVKEYVRFANPSGKILSTLYVSQVRKSEPVVLLPDGIDSVLFMRKIKEML